MYYCGWDGGGTKTTVCCIDRDGRVTAQASFGPLNPNGAQCEKVAQTVRDALAFMAKQPKGLSGCGGLIIGIAGASNLEAVRLVEDTLIACEYMGPVRLLGDQEIALAGAVQGSGAVLIAGTGAICFGRDTNGKPFRVGGWGYLVDDLGSGYAIGRDMLTAVVQAEDGRIAPTRLTSLIYERLNAHEIRDVITWLYAPTTGKKEIASLSPLLLTALQQGDSAAAAIADKAADDLACMVETAWRKTGMTGGELALAGSIFAHYPTIRQRLVRRLADVLPDLAVIDPRGTPAEGAAALARQEAL